MARNASIGFLLLGLAVSAQAQTPFSSLLYTSGNVTDNQPSTSEYAICQTDSALSDFGSPVTTQQLESIPVDSRWFGSSTVNASSFAVQDCSMLKLQLGRSVNVYSGPVTSSCEVTWYESATYVSVLVNLTADASFWTVSLPKVAGAITRTTCYGTRTQCLLASVVPCASMNLGGAGLSSYLSGQVDACPVGEYSPDSESDKDLIYGLQTTFYPNAFDCKNNDPSTVYTVPNLTDLTPNHRFDRCQGPINYMVPNTTFPSSPALPAGEFSSCYAAKLEGFVEVQNNTDLVFLTPEPVPSYYNAYRVCLRFSNLVKLTLNDVVLLQSNTVDYDAVLTCIDIPDLPHGFLPFTLEYASPPNAVDSIILQFYIIPVVQVVSDFRPGFAYQVAYECDCCGLFSASGNCCAPLDSCSFRATECKDEETPPLPIFSPPPLTSNSPPPSPLPVLESPSPPPPPPKKATPPPPASGPSMGPTPSSRPAPPRSAPYSAPPSSPAPAPIPSLQAPSPALHPSSQPSPSIPQSPLPMPYPPILPYPPTVPVEAPGPAPKTPPPLAPAPTTPSALAPAPKGPTHQAPAPGTPPPMCPCDQKCTDKGTNKIAAGEVDDVSYATFKGLVSEAASWEELEVLLQE